MSRAAIAALGSARGAGWLAIIDSAGVKVTQTNAAIDAIAFDGSGALVQGSKLLSLAKIVSAEHPEQKR